MFPKIERPLLALLSCLAATSALVTTACAERLQVPVYGHRVVASFPHDDTAYTQGLVFSEGELFEGTGEYGHSSLRLVDLESGQVLRQLALPADIFGEGITAWGDAIVQLTWREHLGLLHDRATFAPVGQFDLAGEGWGITQDGRHWIVSDGSATLRFLDPETHREVRRVEVRDAGRPVKRLNELEYVEGEVWANIWYEDRLVRISPDDGAVLGYVDLTGLWPNQRRRRRDAVLNGIAYDANTRGLYVTGKYWPRLYRIELVSPEPNVTEDHAPRASNTGMTGTAVIEGSRR
jgi:glutamine cyclotransferase